MKEERNREHINIAKREQKGKNDYSLTKKQQYIVALYNSVFSWCDINKTKCSNMTRILNHVTKKYKLPMSIKPLQTRILLAIAKSSGMY